MFLVRTPLRAVFRHRFRSAIVIVVSIVMVLFINMYANAITQHVQTLAELHADIDVDGHVTSADGSRTDDLNISENLIAQLEQSGFVSQEIYSRNLRYGLEPWQDTRPVEIYNNLINSPRLVGVNTIAAIPDFSHDKAIGPLYLDGYDNEIFSSSKKVCIVSEEFLQNTGFELGSEVQFAVAENPDLDSLRRGETNSQGLVTMEIVGVYPGSDRAPVYYPWATSTELYQELDLPLTWDRARFTLQNTEDLEDFKAYLKNLRFVSPYEIGSNPNPRQDRLGFIINDAILVNATASVKSYIDFMTVLYPVIYLLCAGIGFWVSYLLVRLRKPEFAIMRSLGASRTVSFMSFFIQQTLLCVLGAALGLVLTQTLAGSITGLQVYSVLGYLAFYLVGSAIAIFAMNQVNVIKILTAKE